MGKAYPLNEEIAEEICEAIASNSKGLRKLCKLPEHAHWPAASHIFRWMHKHPEFREQYAKAKIDQIESLVDEIIDIGDDSSKDNIENEQGKIVCNSEYVARSRLRVDIRKWLASKLVPKLYGEPKNLRHEDDAISEFRVEDK